jgi:ATP-dependent RNA helicase DDX20
MHPHMRSDDVEAVDPNASFALLCLPEPLLAGLKRAGYVKPSPVQMAAIPLCRAGADVLIQAKSGTGKTCVFAVAILEHLNVGDPSPQACVVAPTREIAVQIRDVIRALGYFVSPNLSVHAFIGGLPIAADRALLKKECHVMVGTPGRLLALFEGESVGARTLARQALRRVVLDEVDQLFGNAPMAKMVTALLKLMPADTRQTIVCSATMPDVLKADILVHLRPSVQQVLLCPDTPSLRGVKQFYLRIDSTTMSSNLGEAGGALGGAEAEAVGRYATFAAKAECLLSLLARIPFQQCVIFSNNRTRAAELVDVLGSAGWPARCVAGAHVPVRVRL